MRWDVSVRTTVLSLKSVEGDDLRLCYYSHIFASFIELTLRRGKKRKRIKE